MNKTYINKHKSNIKQNNQQNKYQNKKMVNKNYIKHTNGGKAHKTTRTTTKQAI